MISLGIRKVVDTSDWDQSFVDGQGTNLTGINNLKRPSHGERVVSGSAQQSTWNLKELDAQETMNCQMSKARTTCDKSVPLESFPAERRSRHVNPFLDSGLSKEGQHRFVGRKSGIALNCRTGGNDVPYDEHEFDISVHRDLDTRGRKTQRAADEVTAWLDSLRLFDTSQLHLSRSTSSSPPLLLPHDLLTSHDKTKLTIGKAPFNAQSSVIEEGTRSIEGRPTSGAQVKSPMIEGRSPVFDDRSLLVRTPTTEGWAGVFDERTPTFEGQAPSFEGRSPAIEGRVSVSNGRVHCVTCMSPTLNGSARDAVQSTAAAAPVLDGSVQSHGTTVGVSSEAPMAYSRAATFLPAWDLERLEVVYGRLDACGFYFCRMTMDEARLKLTGYPVGTFLLRDSSDRRFLFSLSIQTRRGTTSIRVVYEGGLFRLDSDPDQCHLMPTFDCVLSLIRHYVRLSAGCRLASLESPPPVGNSYVLRESTGRRDTPVLLRRPLETTPVTLAHSCRKSIHRRLGNHPQNVSRLHLKPSLKDYLSLYPYDI